MATDRELRFQPFSLTRLLFGLLLSLTFCPTLWAVQEAIVVADQAVIYADQEMSSPLGFIRRGKKVKVGDIARNRSQVYPIIVSGKVAYIRVLDISTEKDALDPNRLVAERFSQNSRREEKKGRFTMSYYTYATQISLDKDNANIRDKDAVSWNGLSLKTELNVRESWDFQFLLNYMMLKEGPEKFGAFEVGIGGGYRIIELKRLILRLDGQLLAIPFATYSYEEDFRVNGYGYSAGAGLNLSYVIGKNWGIEASAGV